MKRLVIILFLASVCFADTYTSHQKPNTDSFLDIGTATLYWRYIYGDAFTDGTFTVTGGIITGATWEGVPIDISDFTNLVAGINITLADDTLNVDDAFLINDGDDTTTGTITAAGFTDGIFIVTGGIISGGEIVNTFGDIDIGGNTLTSWDIFTGQIVSHSTSDPQLLLRHTTGIDEAGFYVDSDGDLTITPTGDMILPIHVIIDELTAGVSTFGDGEITHYTAFSNRGAMTMHGDARVEKHLVIGASSWKRGATQPTETYENIFPTLSFQDAQDDVVHYASWVPYMWDNTTDMEVHLHWQHENVNAGKVKWHLSYIGLDHGEDPAGAGTTITQLTAGNHDPDKLISTIFATKMLAANLAKDDDLGLMLWREGTDAGDDTLTEDAELIAVHIHYTMNQIGLPGFLPVTDVLLLDDGASKLYLDDGASFLLIRI